MDYLFGNRRARAHVGGEAHGGAHVASIEQCKGVWVANHDKGHQGLVGQTVGDRHERFARAINRETDG